MDQAKPAREELSRNLTKRRADPTMDRPVRLSGASVSEGSIETWTFHAADIAIITVKSILRTRFHGAVRIAEQKKVAMR